MDQLLLQVLAGLIVIIVGAWWGIGGSTKVVIQGNRKVKKTGKWMIIIAVAMILIGLTMLKKGDPTKWGYDMTNPSTLYGVTLAGYGFLLLLVGKVVTWFQKN